ncbi:BatD family protein [Photobacterium sp. WH77]|uniref:BatD family protein n=1 Tax=unclassified Photobacterium TaxID=2628852 RepID=UPI001EDC0225|nr:MULTISPECIES: BatD family protein [unclassified Photobacterium]MCG2837719.1 BatD family protein [Photobacterium sp. WH77]MCG2845335.1 BatD family protein [Photobacterium sp. WH80]
MHSKYVTFLSAFCRTKLWLSVVLLIGSLLSYSAYAAQVVATVSSNQVGVNEIFELTVSIDDNVSASALDLSPLNNDFIVGTTSTRSMNRFINGSVSRQTQWQVSLAAKAKGDFTIPAFRIGASASDPIRIQVSEHSDAAASTTDLAIEVNGRMDKSRLYVGESQSYMVQIKLGEQLEKASLIAPQGEGLEVVQVGDDHQADTVLNGRRYTIINRKYRITATKPGDITLQGAKLTGTAFKSDSSRRFGMRIPVNIQAEPMPLTILAEPDDYKGLWLPTADLQLEQTWNKDEPHIKVGEPVSRTLTLKMKGTPQSNLPDLSLIYPDSVRVYSEKPVYQQENDYSVMTLKQVIIPRRSGTITLPSLTVNWWNTDKGEKVISQVEGKVLQVQPDATASIPGAMRPSDEHSNGASAGISNPQGSNAHPTAVNQQVQGVSAWWPWLTLVVTLLWLGTLMMWLRSRKQPPLTTESVSSASANSSITDKLIAAVTACQPMQVQTYYNAWDKSHLAAKHRQQLDQAVSAMMTAHYSESPQMWDKSDLLALLQRQQKSRKKAQTANGLEPLVPEIPAADRK